ncbi:MAG TPA: hypothetical protein PKK10_04205 [Woeseiaceae bacterium]|nr:hypothetical protein [Woeseiaceae bacterium]
MTGNGEFWHVPFQGRNPSEVYNQNFLYQYENVYVMDNHRAAYWCWLRECDGSNAFSLIHIDRHYDCMPATNLWLDAIPDVANITIEEYLGFEVPVDENGPQIGLFRWDNYLTLFLHRHAEHMRQFFIATHRDGAAPLEPPTDVIEPWELPGAVQHLKDTDDAPWICNIDLDYFCFSQDQKVQGRLVSEVYIASLFTIVQHLRSNGTIDVVTLCLSPECCGGWDAAEVLAEIACPILDVPFRLADSS